MSLLAQTLEAHAVRFERVDSPSSLACWQARFSPVSLIVEPPAVPPQEVIEHAAQVALNLSTFAAKAADFLCNALRDPRYRLTEKELAKLSTEKYLFSSPAAMIWQDGSWMILFRKSDLSIAAEFGIGVNFDGDAPISVEDLSDAEHIDT